MSSDRVEDLLLRWEELSERGESVTPEELCRDCPELLDELRRRVRALQALDPALDAAGASRRPDAAGRLGCTAPGASRARRAPRPFPATRSWGSWAAAAWASSTRPGSQASTASWP